MATTDARTGFRLPWSSDPRPEGDESGAAAEQTTAEADSTTSAHGQGPGDTSVTSAGGETTQAASGGPNTDSPRPPTARRPSKFLADLTKAMQTAAEAAREEAVGRLQADAKTAIEEIHGRSATEADDLRRRADEDVSSIREWSKQEIARIRDETERKVSDRKGQLEREIEDHAALIERQIDHIQGQVSAFETEMATFFERLIAEEDPTRFAEMAESLPEPPPIEELAAWAATATVSTRPVPTAAADPIATGLEESNPAEAVDETTSVTADRASLPVEEAAFETPAAVAEIGVEGSSEDSPGFVGEPDTPGFQSTGAHDESASATDSPSTTAVSDPWLVAGAVVAADPAEDAPDTRGEGDAYVPAVDPRLAAFGMSADFAAAEAEAAAAVSADDDVEDIPVIGDEALAARLAGLVGSDTAASRNGAAETIATKVVVNGLVSVASIASFKRHLGRLAGVQSVGVSSGPEGEFVFAVTHGPDIVLTDAIPALPGFHARITGSTDDTIEVTARDPDAEG